MIFYIYVSNAGELYISPLKDEFREAYEVLTPGLPLCFAEFFLHKFQEKGTTGFLGGLSVGNRGKSKGSRTAASVKAEILKLLRKEPSLASMPWGWEHPVGMEDPSGKTEVWQARLEDFLRRVEGRLLGKTDLQRLAGESGVAYEVVLELCQETALKGEAEWLPAVRKSQGAWQCQRCGETELEEWISVYGLTATCPSCSALGALSSLHALYRSIGSSSGGGGDDLELGNQADPMGIEFCPRWELSEAQKLAAQEVLEFVKKSSFNSEAKFPQQVLLWAACGAGKTEVCFPAAAWALEQGQRVLFAAPRQDVVLDVAPRLKRDFPGLKTMVLTGISPERFGVSSFVLATTHQILRFYQAFDLIFLDEMDAFPYHGNAALAWGIQQALKPEGKLVYLTATPSAESLDKVKTGRLDIIRLPARHHRQAVPVPEWRKLSGELDPKQIGKSKEAQEVFRLAATLGKLGPVMLFVPKISWVEPWVDLLQKEFSQWQVSGSYSADSHRREKIEGLRQKKYQVFVSTSILERGVTIPDAQVIVLAADHEVFDERALVQMAGRVGRTQENPTGTAIFLSQCKTPEIEKAIKWITEQNSIAKAQGLIDN